MIHLNAKTDYSFMKGFGSPEQWYERCKAMGVDTLGIADINSTWGHVPFSKTFNDVKLLLGVQVAVVPNLTKDQRHGLVTLIANGSVGLGMLYELMSIAHQQMYYRPRIKWSQLADLKGYCEVIVDRCSLGDFVDFQKLGFGYVGASTQPGHMRHVFDEFPVVAAPSPCYPSILQREAFELVGAIAEGRKFGEGNEGYHMMTRAELEGIWKGYNLNAKDEWFTNAEFIAERCNAVVPQATNIKPRTKYSLARLAERGAARRGIDLEGAYGARLRHELSVIENKKFEDYFLFVEDVVTWAKGRMLVGPCRGSSGGSLVCFLLGITELDPLKYGTLFERFLDVGRSDWPDIDIDFPDAKRDQVFQYLREKYGDNHVARLGTVSKFGGKSAINDTGKAFGVEYSATRDIGRAVDGTDTTLSNLFNNMPADLQPMLDANPAILKAALLDGHPRHHGVHAAGVCVTNEPVTNFGVLNREGTISLDLKAAERVNLLKLDALGLRTLSVIEDCCEQVGIEPSSLYDLTFSDAEHDERGDLFSVYDIFNKDQVTGIFQFEGPAVRQLMREITVENFYDLCALTSLARPGPLVGGAAGNWCKRRSGEEDFEYSHPIMESATSETLGTIVYQEQAMEIVRHLAGFDDLEVNGFRRAVGKKDPEALREYMDKFVAEASKSFADHYKEGLVDVELIEDAIEQGVKAAEKLWDEMCEFGSYAFNKSHAVAYSMVSYQCAYLKTLYPLEFAVSQLRNAASPEQGKALLRELQAEGHEIVTFDYQRSHADWSIQDGKLYGGFTAVKGIGKKTAESFVGKRTIDPDNWLDDLTEAQRNKLLKPFNTPWDDLNRRGKMYRHLYDDPDAHDIIGPVLRIDQIPEEKGQYCFIGTLVKRQLRTKTDDKGKAMPVKATFLNLYFEDDTGEVGCCISRFKYDAIGAPLMELPEAEGRDFLVRGTIISDGRVWLFIDKLKELTDDKS